MSITVWNVLGLGDRETLITGILGWLLEPSGDHGLGDRFLRMFLERAGIHADGDLTTGVEVRAKGGRRFDLLVQDAGDPLLAIEVKCKTGGTLAQLRRYAEDGTPVVRIGFGEWNFALDDAEQKEFRLITFDQLGQDLRRLEDQTTRYQDMLRSVTDAILGECAGFEALQDYYVREIGDSPPTDAKHVSLGTRFVNRLFWTWIRERMRRDHPDLVESGWTISSQASGVWFAGSHVEVDAEGRLALPNLDVVLAGPLDTWIHFEVIGNRPLFGPPDETVGKVQVRIRREASYKQRLEVCETLRRAGDSLQEAGFSLPSQRPTSGGYFSAMTKPLRRCDLRYSQVVGLIQGDLERRILGG